MLWLFIMFYNNDIRLFLILYYLCIKQSVFMVVLCSLYFVGWKYLIKSNQVNAISSTISYMRIGCVRGECGASEFDFRLKIRSHIVMLYFNHNQ